MPECPRLPTEEVVKALQDRLMRYDRSPFAGMLADAVSVRPSLETWQKLAEDNPEGYVRTVGTLARVSGFTDRSESLNVTVKANPADLARTLVIRYGVERATQMFELHGLPVDLVAQNADADPNYTAPIEGKAEPAEDVKPASDQA